MNITLIGMPGSGKSTVGVLLAKRLGMDFIDVDLLIQKEEGKLLWQIIDEVGPEGFLEVENRINSKVKAENSVIAPGGSVIYGQEAMNHLGAISTIIYLKIGPEELVRRLGDLEERGVVLRKGMTVKDLYMERSPLYEKYAHITVDEKGFDAGGVVDQIRQILRLKQQ